MKKLPQLLTLFVVLFVVGYIARDCQGWRQEPSKAALRDTVKVADGRREVIHDTVTVYLPRAASAKAKSDALDSAVVVVNDSTIQVSQADSAKYYTTPPLVVADLQALRVTVAVQDTTIHLLQRQTEADSLRIVARDHLIQALKPPRCSRKCGFLLGVTAGLLIHRAVK